MDMTAYRIACNPEEVTPLQQGVLDSLEIAARRYRERTGDELVVTGGVRTLRRMAELMADFTDNQLEGMYCRNGYPSYIREILAARAKAAPASLSAQGIYDILRHRSEGYVSAHLYGAAVDIRSRGLKDPELLKSLLQQENFRVLDENSLGVPCIHATKIGIPQLIVRE